MPPPSGIACTTLRVDVRSRDAVETAVAQAGTAMGGLDRVVNSAGIFRFSPFLEIIVEDWRRMLDINLTGTFLVCQAVIPRLVAGGGGRIVNVASVAGVRAGPNSAHYIASKWGMVGLTKALAVEFGPRGVIVNAVAPATIPETGIGQSSLEQKVEMGWGADAAEAIANQETQLPAAPTRHGGRRRARHPVPAQRGRRLDDRPGAEHGRRRDRELTASAASRARRHGRPPAEKHHRRATSRVVPSRECSSR